MVTKTVSTKTLQSGLHLKRVNLWRAHVYIYLGGGVAHAWVLEIMFCIIHFTIITFGYSKTFYSKNLLKTINSYIS